MKHISFTGTSVQNTKTENLRADDIIDQNLAGRMTVYACGLFITTAVILLFGLTMLYSASYQTDGAYFFFTQLLWLGISTVVGVAVFLTGFRILADYSPFILFVLVAMLVVAVTCYEATNGAYRWIKMDFGALKISLQPSEFVKVILPLFVGKYCADNFRNIPHLIARHGAWFPIMITVMMCGMVMLGHDLGTTLLIFTVSMLILFVAGLRTRYYVFPALGGVGLFFIIKFFDQMRWARLTSFLDPEKYQETIGYQLWLSILALGSGSWTGVGFMESRLKAAYLPEKHTDFILAVIGEELGYVALLGVLAAYFCFVFFALKISCNASSRQGMFTGVGLTATIIIQALINIGVVSGALPTKGIPAPFLSYGGSSLLMSAMTVALLLNIAADTAAPNFNYDFWLKVRKFFQVFKRKKAGKQRL